MNSNILLVSVDVESDGPVPPLYSMISFGAVVVEPSLNRTFYGKTAPLDGAKWLPEALAVSDTTHGEHLTYPSPLVTMTAFWHWCMQLKIDGQRITFVSDNPAFDWQWINYYFHAFPSFHAADTAYNPFGYSARRIGDIWSGLQRKIGDHSSWKDLRKTRHTHNPVDDARGNAEALLEIMKRLHTSKES